jgi:DNA primase catalytic core
MKWELRRDTVKKEIHITDIFPTLNAKGYQNCPICNLTRKALVLDNEKIKCWSASCVLNNYNDVIDVYKIIHSLNFKDAIEKLEYDFGISHQAVVNVYEERINTYESAIQIYKNNLWAKENEFAINYLLSRGFKKKAIKHFNLGYAPPNYSLPLNNQLLIEHKLRYESGKDFYQNRIIFPLYNIDNKLIHFTGRSLNAKSTVRYLDTATSNKLPSSKDLLAFEHIIPLVDNNTLIVTEGYPDAFIYNQYGIPSVGLMGLEKLNSHKEKLERFNRIIFIFDNDKFPSDHKFYPNQYKSWSRIIPQLYHLQCMFNDKVLYLFTVPPEEGKDSNDWLGKYSNLSKDKILNYIESNKKDFLDFTIEQEASDISNHEYILRLIALTNRGKNYFKEFIPQEFSALDYALAVMGA